MQSILQINRLRRQAERAIHCAEDKRSCPNFEHGPSTEDKHDDIETRETQETQTPDSGPVRSVDQPIASFIPGVEVRQRSVAETVGDHDGQGGLVFIVRWEGPDDPMNPMNWPLSRRAVATALVSLLAFCISAASSADAPVTRQSSVAYHVSQVPGSLTTGCYLLGIGVGSLFAGSFSETLGRNIVYAGAMSVFMIWTMAAGLAPNFAAKIIFRFLAGFFGSAPLTVGGGTIADLYNPLQATLAFPLMAVPAFSGPILGPVITSYVGEPGGLSWRWSEWIMLILAGAIFTLIILLQPETYGPLILTWKAKQYRELTGDQRYRSELDIVKSSVVTRLIANSTRPFVMVWTEPIILTFCLYLSILYIVLFTFFNGYEFVFGETYGLSQGMTNLIWLAALVGILCLLPTLPLIYHWTKREFSRAAAEDRHHPPEIRLWFAMLGGSFAIPISLFWIGWTASPHISIWSPIIASVLFGYGVMTIFTSAYMYIIEAYLIYAASALSFNAFMRYVIAGGLTVVGIPWYRNLGVHYTLTILACISAIMTPVPFFLYRYGRNIRSWSKNVQNKT